MISFDAFSKLSKFYLNITSW